MRNCRQWRIIISEIIPKRSFLVTMSGILKKSGFLIFLINYSLLAFYWNFLNDCNCSALLCRKRTLCNKNDQKITKNKLYIIQFQQLKMEGFLSKKSIKKKKKNIKNWTLLIEDHKLFWNLESKLFWIRIESNLYKFDWPLWIKKTAVCINCYFQVCTSRERESRT